MSHININGFGSGITPLNTTPVADGAGGLTFTSNYVMTGGSIPGAGKSTFLYGDGTRAEINFNGDWRIWGGAGNGLVMATSDFAGTQVFQFDASGNFSCLGGLHSNYWTFQPAIANPGYGNGFNKTPINCPPSSSVTLFSWTPDDQPSNITFHVSASGGSSTGSDYWFFDRIFRLQPTGITGGGTHHTTFTDTNAGAGRAVVADEISSGLAGSTITCVTSGLTITFVLTNASPTLTGRITANFTNSNGHIQ